LDNTSQATHKLHYLIWQIGKIFEIEFARKPISELKKELLMSYFSFLLVIDNACCSAEKKLIIEICSCTVKHSTF
jgi:hypothetical protein